MHQVDRETPLPVLVQAVWICLRAGATTTIPNWGSKDLKSGTISRLLKDLGISKGDFENI
jgi:hypothetical protein